MRYTTILLFSLVFIYSACGAPNYITKLNQSQNLIKNQQFNMAKTEIMKLIEVYPEKPEPYYLLGLINYTDGKYSECLLNFNEAEQRGINKSPEFYLNMGIALYNTGNLIEAEKNFNILVKFESDTSALKYIGLIRYKFGDYAGSVDAFQRATSIKDDVNSLYIFGMALYRHGMNSESLDIFMKTFNLAPANEDIIFQTANLLMLNGQNEDAQRMYSKIPPGSVYHTESIYNQAEAYIRTGDFERAVELLEDYVNVEPNDHAALFNLSSTLIKTGKYVYATDILSKLINDEKYHIRVAYNLGLANHKLGKYAESVHYFSEAVTTNTDNAVYLYSYGLALSDYGEIEEARAQMNALLLLDPENEDALEWLNQHPFVEKPPEESDRYYSKNKSYSIILPDEWEKKEDYGEGLSAYSPIEGPKDKFREYVMVDIEELSEDLSLDEYYSEILKVLNEQLPGFQQFENGQTTIDNTDAKWIILSLKLGEEQKGLSYMLIKGRKAYGISLWAEPDSFSRFRSTFENMAQSFRFE